MDRVVSLESVYEAMLFELKAKYTTEKGQLHADYVAQQHVLEQEYRELWQARRHERFWEDSEGAETLTRRLEKETLQRLLTLESSVAEEKALNCQLRTQMNAKFVASNLEK
jgi:hypothetical protein